MTGRVNYVSPDSLQEESKGGVITYYRVKVSISEKDYKNTKSGDIEIRPGMTATVDIQTGKRSIFSYLIKPITKTFGDAMEEP